MRAWVRAAVVPAVCLAGVFAAGCGDKDDEGDAVCNSQPLAAGFPADGATDVFERSAVDAVLVEDDLTSAAISVVDSSGTDVAGTQHYNLGYVSFQVDGAYTAGETYTATLSDWTTDDGCEPISWSFTVTDTPLAPIADPQSLVDRAWQIDLRQGRAVFPDNMNAVFEDQMKVDLLIGVTDVEGSTVGLRASSTTEDRTEQDLVSYTTDFDGSFAPDPHLLVEQDELKLVIFNDVITAMNLKLTGSWDETAGTWVEVGFTTLIDTRELVDVVVGADAEDDAVCELFSSTFGVFCHECPPEANLFAERGEFCLTMVVDGMTLPETDYQLIQVLPPVKN